MTLYGKLLLILDSETAVSEWSEAADFVLVYKNNRVKIVYKKENHRIYGGLCVTGGDGEV